MSKSFVFLFLATFAFFSIESMDYKLELVKFLDQNNTGLGEFYRERIHNFIALQKQLCLLMGYQVTVGADHSQQQQIYRELEAAKKFYENIVTTTKEIQDRYGMEIKDLGSSYFQVIANDMASRELVQSYNHNFQIQSSISQEMQNFIQAVSDSVQEQSIAAPLNLPEENVLIEPTCQTFDEIDKKYKLGFEKVILIKNHLAKNLDKLPQEISVRELEEFVIENSDYVSSLD